jgi:hypothetical protein
MMGGRGLREFVQIIGIRGMSFLFGSWLCYFLTRSNSSGVFGEYVLEVDMPETESRKRTAYIHTGHRNFPEMLVPMARSLLRENVAKSTMKSLVCWK